MYQNTYHGKGAPAVVGQCILHVRGIEGTMIDLPLLLDLLFGQPLRVGTRGVIHQCVF